MPSKLSATSAMGRRLLIGGVSAAVLGVSFLGIKAINTYAYDWKPVQVALPSAVGQVSSATFTSKADQFHEVMLEFESVLPEAQLRDLLKKAHGPPTVDVAWTVATNGKVFAAGDSRTVLYTSTGGRTRLGQIKRRILSNPFHRGRGSFVQVIGRVRARAGQTYQITVERRGLDPVLEATSPKLGLQLTREFWTEYNKGMLIFAQAGLVLIAFSGLLIVCGLGALLLQKRQITATAAS